MSDNLLARVKRLVSGSVNSIVDAVENAAPDTVMKEAIREVENAIDEVRDELGLTMANQHHANKRLAEATAKHEELTERLGTAIAQRRDDLAEAAITRQLDLEAQIPVLEEALKDLNDKEKELQGYIAALQGRKGEMEEDLHTFLESRKSGTGGSGDPAMPAGLAAEKKADKAETAFNRVMRGTTGIAGTVKADRETAAKLAELEKISKDNRVKERLAALKATRTED